MSATADAMVTTVMVSGHEQGRSTVLSLSGEGDLATRFQLQVALMRAVSNVDEDVLIVDMSRLEFCDVSCARLICDASRAGRVVVTGMSPTVGRMFDVLDPGHRLSRRGADEILPLIPTQRRGPNTSARSAPHPQSPMELAPRAPMKSAYPTPDVADFIGLNAPPAGRASSVLSDPRVAATEP